MEYLNRMFSWCRVPLTYGKAIGRHATDEGPEFYGTREMETLETVRNISYNGTISSIQMFIVIVAVSTATILSVRITERFDATVNLFVLITLMLVGLIVMYTISLYKKNFVASRTSSDPEDDYLPMIGIAIFCTLGCILDVFHIVATVSCDEVWRICKDRHIHVLYVTSVLFNVLKIVYLGGETVFCLTFNRCTFSDRPSTRYGLMLLQAANFSLWFEALVYESSNMLENWPRISLFSQKCLDDSVNVSVHVLQCLFHNNTFYDAAEHNVCPVTLPFSIEFTLLVGETTCHWFFHCATSERPQRQRDEATAEMTGVSEEEHEDKIENLATDNRDLSETSTELISFHIIEEDHLERRRSHSTIGTTSQKMFVVVTFMLNGILVALAVLQRVQEQWALQNAFVCYMVAFWVLTTLNVAIGFQISRDFKYKSDMHFNGFEYLLLVSSFGPLVFVTFTVLAFVELRLSPNEMHVIYPEGDRPYAPFQIMLQLCNALEVYFQTTFVLFAERIVLDSRERSHRQILFKNIILFLAIANGSMWLICTSDAFQAKEWLLQEKYFEGKESAINTVVMSFSLFFRFNSCLLFTKVFVKLNQSDVNG